MKTVITTATAEGRFHQKIDIHGLTSMQGKWSRFKDSIVFQDVSFDGPGDKWFTMSVNIHFLIDDESVVFTTWKTEGRLEADVIETCHRYIPVVAAEIPALIQKGLKDA